MHIYRKIHLTSTSFTKDCSQGKETIQQGRDVDILLLVLKLIGLSEELKKVTVGGEFVAEHERPHTD